MPPLLAQCRSTCPSRPMVSSKAAHGANEKDYLIPTYRNMTGSEKQGWALLNVGVGANDIVS